MPTSKMLSVNETATKCLARRRFQLTRRTKCLSPRRTGGAARVGRAHAGHGRVLRVDTVKPVLRAPGVSAGN